MAIFNPQIPDTQDPNWLGWSKPISVTPGDSSTGALLSTFAEGLGGALKLADKGISSIAEDETYDKAKAIQQDYQTRLADANDYIRGTRTDATASSPTGGAATAGASLLPSTGQVPNQYGLPSQVQRLPVQIDTLGQARANGKLSETDYYARLDALAKDIRSRYPGYREQIDAAMTKATGVDPANAYIKSVLGDINSFVTGANTDRNKIISEITNSTINGSPESILAQRLFAEGKITTSAQAMAVLSPAWQRHYTYTTSIQQNNAIESDEKIKVLNGTKALNTDASSYIQASISAIVMPGGAQKVTDYLAAKASGTAAPIPEDQAIMLGQTIDAAKTKAYTDLYKKYSQSPGVDPRTGLPIASALETLGDEGVKRIINNNLAWYDQVKEHVTNKDVGAMFTTAKLLEATNSQATAYVLRNSKPMAMLSVIKNVAGPNFLATPYIASAIGTMGKNETDVFNAAATMFATQPGINSYPNMPAPSGIPTTPSEILKGAQSQTQTPGAPVVGSREFNRQVVELSPKMILDTSLPTTVRINAARGAFDPANKNFIGLIEGRKEKMQVFQTYTSPQITSAIKSLGDPNIWTQFKTWAGGEFANQLFNEDVQILNKAVNYKGLDISWDFDNHQYILSTPRFKNINLQSFKPEFVAGTELQGPFGYTVLKDTINAINRINTGISSIAGIYKQDNLDPNTFMPSLLQAANINQNSISKLLAYPFKQRALQYNEENAPASGSLGDFLKNPAPGKFKIDSKPSSSKPTTRGNITDENIISIDAMDIPEGMSARELIQKLKKEGRW